MPIVPKKMLEVGLKRKVNKYGKGVNGDRELYGNGTRVVTRGTGKERNSQIDEYHDDI